MRSPEQSSGFQLFRNESSVLREVSPNRGECQDADFLVIVRASGSVLLQTAAAKSRQCETTLAGGGMKQSNTMLVIATFIDNFLTSSSAQLLLATSSSLALHQPSIHDATMYDIIGRDSWLVSTKNVEEANSNETSTFLIAPPSRHQTPSVQATTWSLALHDLPPCFLTTAATKE